LLICRIKPQFKILVEEKIILGIDPGTNIMGYGLIKCRRKEMELITMGILNLKKLDGVMDKLHYIFSETSRIIRLHGPDEMAIEAPFYAKNIQSMLKLGRAQGVAIASALQQNLPVYEYSPRKVKQSITGRGGASKEQVAAMLINLLNIKELPDYLDATDGLALAVCHHFQNISVVKTSSASAGKSKSGWASFIKENPGRVK